MAANPVPSTHRKDLQDLLRLSRAPVLAYLQKQAPPSEPRSKAGYVPPPTYPILAAFSPTRLVTWAWQYLSHRIGRRHPFLTYKRGDADQGVYAMDDEGDIRIALAGDWGTGTDEAAEVAKEITAFEPHFAIHLGDVYFVGTRSEVDENFLGVKNPNSGYAPCAWPMGSLGAFALNGNHEMYALGYGYFDLMLPKLGMRRDGKPAGQKASYFCLENAHWRLIALDTGYNSIGWPVVEMIWSPACDLTPEQIAWLREIVKPQPNDPRGVILLTHHQYYSRFDDWYTKQAIQLAEFISRPVLWFWGHEHRLAIYPENGAPGGVRAYGRCVGHGGMPVDLPPATPKHDACPVEFVDERRYPNDENLTVGYNGFVRLTLRKETLSADYVDVCGTVIFSETWRTEAAGLKRLSAKA